MIRVGVGRVIPDAAPGGFLEGLPPATVACPVFPCPPAGGLAAEGHPGCVPDLAWEEGLPGAGGGPGAF